MNHIDSFLEDIESRIRFNYLTVKFAEIAKEIILSSEGHQPTIVLVTQNDTLTFPISYGGHEILAASLYTGSALDVDFVFFISTRKRNTVDTGRELDDLLSNNADNEALLIKGQSRCGAVHQGLFRVHRDLSGYVDEISEIKSERECGDFSLDLELGSFFKPLAHRVEFHREHLDSLISSVNEIMDCSYLGKYRNTTLQAPAYHRQYEYQAQ